MITRDTMIALNTNIACGIVIEISTRSLGIVIQVDEIYVPKDNLC